MLFTTAIEVGAGAVPDPEPPGEVVAFGPGGVPPEPGLVPTTTMSLMHITGFGHTVPVCECAHRIEIAHANTAETHARPKE